MVELVHEVLIVFLVPLDVLARMDGPHEVYTVAVASLNKFVDVASLVFGIRLAPVGRAVVWVVLRTIHILVEFVASIIFDERETHLMRPRLTIESLYHTTQWQVGIVVALGIRHLAASGGRVEQLSHCLQSVESSTLVVANDVDTVVVGCEQVGSRHHLLESCFLCCLLAEVDSELHALLILLNEAKVVGKLLLLVDDVYALREVDELLSVNTKVVGCRVNDDAMMIDFLSRHHIYVLFFATL